MRRRDRSEHIDTFGAKAVFCDEMAYNDWPNYEMSPSRKAASERQRMRSFGTLYIYPASCSRNAIPKIPKLLGGAGMVMAPLLLSSRVPTYQKSLQSPHSFWKGLKPCNC